MNDFYVIFFEYCNIYSEIVFYICGKSNQYH